MNDKAQFWLIACLQLKEQLIGFSAAILLWSIVLSILYVWKYL